MTEFNQQQTENWGDTFRHVGWFYLRLLLPLTSLLTLLLGVGVLQDSPSFCPALQQLADLVHHPQVPQQFLPVEERFDPLLLPRVCLLLLFLRFLLSDFCGFTNRRRAGQRRLQRNIWFNLFLLPHCVCSHQHAFTIYLQLLSLNILDNTVCFSCLDNKRYLNSKWETFDKKYLQEYYSSSFKFGKSTFTQRGQPEYKPSITRQQLFGSLLWFHVTLHL